MAVRGFIFSATFAVVALLVPAGAEALCAGDAGWKSKFADIQATGPGQMTAAASVEIDHQSNHPSCYGEMSTRAHVVGGGCASGWDTKIHYGTSASDMVSALVACPADCGFLYYGGGEVRWNTNEDEDFWQGGSARIMCDCQPPPGGCTIEGCVWDYYECDCVDCCPLVLDVSGRGYKLTSAEEGVLFDINADGQLDAISWTDPNREVAFLVFDRNANGIIDDGEELFGNVTPVQGNMPSGRALHGFDALASLEDPLYGPSRPDGRIDARDAAYQKLLLWVDRNHDGISQPEELRLASAAGLVAIETRYREDKRVDEHGNEFRLRGIGWWQRGEELEARLFYDVYFVPLR